MRMILSAAALAIAVFGLVPGAPVSLVAPAEAKVGRPLTPISVAGVARRTTRRAVVYSSAVATPTTVVVAATPTDCYTTYDAYGQKVTTCK